MMMNPRSLSAAVRLALLAGACSGSGSGATLPSAVPADASVTESFSAVVSIGGAVFYSFPIAQFGNVAVTLTGITGTGLTEDIGLAIGVADPGVLIAPVAFTAVVAHP
jgi:hypothetical protein